MNFSPGLRGGNQLAGGSLRTVAAILDSYTSGTGGWGFCFGVCVNNFIPCTFLPGLREGNRLAGGSLLMVAATLVRIQAERKGVGIWFWCVSTVL